MFKEIQLLASKNKTLREIQGILLPKLISGEIDVSTPNLDFVGD
jgi:hypothetical protein